MNQHVRTSARTRVTTCEIETADLRLREPLTPAEAGLWEAIRDRQLAGLRFRRQHPVGRFSLDFYCPSHRLVVEVESGSHDNRRAYDQARIEALAAFGYHVLRFRNADVLDRLPAVLETIRETARILAGGHVSSR
jgi:very-short-patch-repair endonuclease